MFCCKWSISTICALALVAGIGSGGVFADTVHWTGEGDGELWSNPYNWSSFPDVPDEHNDIVIDSADHILQNVQNLYTVKSLKVYGAPCGSVTVIAMYVFKITGDFWSEDQVPYSFTLESGSTLELEDIGSGADLSYVNLTKEVSELWDPGRFQIAGDVINCSVTDYGNSRFIIDGQIRSSGTTRRDWSLLNHSTFTAGSATLWGDWVFLSCIDEGSGNFRGVHLKELYVSDELGTSLRIGDGTDLYLEPDTFARIGLIPSQGTSNDFHKLIYGPGNATVNVCTANGQQSTVLDFGENTCIEAYTRTSTLDLNLWSEFHIQSSFALPEVCSHWDTRSVNITAPPVTEQCQSIELISPQFAIWYADPPVAFWDVPCHGAFQDLTLPDGESGAVPVAMVDEYDNAAVGWGSEESTGFFRNVTIGDNRTIQFYSPDDVIYYTGTLQFGSGATAQIGQTPVPIDSVIVKAVRTIYGDWNGDCVITNSELGDLQLAILGGPPAHNPLMDYDCDGVLGNTDLSAFLDNLNRQPPCGRSKSFADGDGEVLAAPYEGYADVPALAVWLAEELTEEELSAFVSDLDAAVTEFAGTPAGDDLASLFICLR